MEGRVRLNEEGRAEVVWRQMQQLLFVLVSREMEVAGSRPVVIDYASGAGRKE